MYDSAIIVRKYEVSKSRPALLSDGDSHFETLPYRVQLMVLDDVWKNNSVRVGCDEHT